MHKQNVLPFLLFSGAYLCLEAFDADVKPGSGAMGVRPLRCLPDHRGLKFLLQMRHIIIRMLKLIIFC